MRDLYTHSVSLSVSGAVASFAADQMLATLFGAEQWPGRAELRAELIESVRRKMYPKAFDDVRKLEAEAYAPRWPLPR